MKPICDIVSRMAECPLFLGIPTDERARLVAATDVRIRQYGRGEMIVNECDPAAEVIVLLKGSVSVYECLVKEDRRHLVGHLVAGDVFGASFPVLELKSCPCMLVADRSAEVVLLKAEKIRELIRKERYPQLVANLYLAVARQGFAAMNKLALVGCYEIADRIRLYQRWSEEGRVPRLSTMTPAGLAEYLGVNRTALYRALAKLRKDEGMKLAFAD